MTGLASAYRVRLEAQAESRRLDRMERLAPKAWALHARLVQAATDCQRTGALDQVALLENAALAIWWFCERGRELTEELQAEGAKLADRGRVALQEGGAMTTQAPVLKVGERLHFEDGSVWLVERVTACSATIRCLGGILRGKHSVAFEDGREVEFEDYAGARPGERTQVSPRSIAPREP